jgi:hypothetical protein
MVCDNYRYKIASGKSLFTTYFPYAPGDHISPLGTSRKAVTIPSIPI